MLERVGKLGVWFEEGTDGAEGVVTVHASTHQQGVVGMYAYIAERCGKCGTDWGLVMSALVHDDANARSFKYITIRSLADDSERDFAFDVTEILDMVYAIVEDACENGARAAERAIDTDCRGG